MARVRDLQEVASLRVVNTRVWRRISEALRTYYDAIATQAVPERWGDLINRLPKEMRQKRANEDKSSGTRQDG